MKKRHNNLNRLFLLLLQIKITISSYNFIPANFLVFQRVRLPGKPKFTGFFHESLRARTSLEKIKSETVL